VKKTIIVLSIFILIMVFIFITQAHAGPPVKYKAEYTCNKNYVVWYYKSETPMPPTVYYPMLPPDPRYYPRPLPCPILVCAQRIIACPFRILRSTVDALFGNLY